MDLQRISEHIYDAIFTFIRAVSNPGYNQFSFEQLSADAGEILIRKLLEDESSLDNSVCTIFFLGWLPCLGKIHLLQLHNQDGT
jgi:hypothetical protein